MTRMKDQLLERTTTLLNMLTQEGSPFLMTSVPGIVIPLYPGGTAAAPDGDGSMNCGQLSLRIVSASPRINSQGGNASIEKPCLVLWWDVLIEVKVFRCAPTITDTGVAPKPADYAAAGEQMLDDMDKIQSALLATGWVFTIGPWTPLGPEGGQFSGSYTFTTRTDP